MKTNKLKIKVLIITTIISFCLAFSISNAAATTARYAYNFDDTTTDEWFPIYDNGGGDYLDLAVYYDMGEGTCIIKGVNYLYGSIGGISSMEIRFEGDTVWFGWVDSGIPVAGVETWRIFRLAGPNYLLDDDPVIRFMGREAYSNCIVLFGDTPSIGHSAYDYAGFGWTIDTAYEYIVELIYEWVVTLPIDTIDTGSFTSTDNVDAYFISLTAEHDYRFDLERTSGSGDFNMRVVTYQDLTNDNLVSSSGTTYPKNMNYTALSTGTYVLLVEVDNAGVDVADYSIILTDTAASHPSSVGDDSGGDSSSDDKDTSEDFLEDFLAYLEYWWLQAIIGGILSTAAGLSVKKMYGQQEKKKGINKRRRGAKRDIEDFENNTRSYIRSMLYEHYGEEWWDKGIPSDIQLLIEERGLTHSEAKNLEFLEIDDFYTIISDNENWTNIFSPVFENKETLRMNMDKLKNFKNNLDGKIVNEEDLNYYNIWIFGIITCFSRGKNIFFSYSTYDTKYFNIAEIAKKLELYPEIDKVFYWEISSGENVVKYMEQALRATRVFVLFCTDSSLNSKAVEDEWNAAFQLRKQDLMKIIPVYVYEDFIPYLLRPLLNIRFDPENIAEFVENLYKEILR